MKEEDLLLTAEDIYPRQKALFDQYEAYYMRTIKEQYDCRGRFWNRDFSSPEAYEKSVEPNRQHFLQLVGGWHWERQDLQLRKGLIAEFSAYTIERVTYRLFDVIETDALLLTPKGEGPFPAILLQIGVNGVPETACGFTEEERGGKGSYHRLGARLAAHGYVVLATRMVTGFAPGKFRDEDHRAPHLMTPRQAELREYILKNYSREAAKEYAPQTRARIYLDRLCRTIRQTLLGTEMFALSRGIDLLESLPQVAPGRLGMYGKSQGGLSAVFLGALEKRLQVSVASAYFNERYHKQVVRSEHYGRFVDTSSEDKIFPYLYEFSDSDVASLICPRCFFVEAGKQDDSVYWKLAQAAFKEVKAIYERLGVADKCDMRIHEGGHEIEPEEDITRVRAVAFLDRWLKA